MHMKKLIRHRAPRYLVRIPLRFRLLASPEMPEEIAESLNLSARGVSFATRFPLALGTPIQLSLKVPEEVTGKPTGWLRDTGVKKRTEDSCPEKTKNHERALALVPPDWTDRDERCPIRHQTRVCAGRAMGGARTNLRVFVPGVANSVRCA